MTEWIEDWFGSEYYSLLYKHRDCDEAKLFLDNLISFLKISSQSRILDCGCGRGRHSIYMSEKGFEVTGIDLCESNITEAKKSEKDNLTFYLHDMRNLFRINYYDVALNLFTSFGYFEKDSENNKAIKSMTSSLKKDGWLVLDFMNAQKEIKELIPNKKIKINGIKFEMKRFVKDDFIVKEIFVCDKEKKYSYREKVKTYKLNDFENFFSKNKLQLAHFFGDYELNSFNEATSSRMILIGKKK